MASAYKKLYQGQVPAAATLLYTVPSLTQTIIKHMSLVNTSAGAVTIRLWHDGSANGNAILPPVSLGAGEFGEFDGDVVMEAGDTLYAQAGSANAITLTAHGMEFA